MHAATTSPTLQNARKRPSMAELLRHPWILQHSRRPSTPAARPAASPLHLPLHELAGQEGSPFGDLHRASLHGAKSCRDFGSLLHAPSAGPAGFAGLLSPSISSTASSLAAAAAVIAVGEGAAAAARPTTSSTRLGPGGLAGVRPGTPFTAHLSTGAAASPVAAAAASPPASPSVATQAAAGVGSPSSHAAGSQHPQQQHAVAPPARATSGHGLAAATADGSFFSAGSFVSASSTSAGIGELGRVCGGARWCGAPTCSGCLLPSYCLHVAPPPRLPPALLPAETSGHSFTHSVAALRALGSSMGLPQATAAPTAEPPSGFLVSF